MEKTSTFIIKGKILKKIKGVVVKGYITRYSDEAEWESILIEIPSESQLVDGDAIPYYLQKEDGKYYEYYGHYAPEGKNAYVSEENFSDFLVEN